MQLKSRYKNYYERELHMQVGTLQGNHEDHILKANSSLSWMGKVHKIANNIKGYTVI